MRYLIDHVLEGLEAYRVQQILVLQRQNEKLDTEIADSYKVAEKTSETVTKQVKALTELVEQQAFIFGEDIHEIIDKLYGIHRAAPKQWKAKDLEKKLKENREDIERLRRANQTKDSEVEVFLRAVQEGGETHVSQHGLKQAGFGHLTAANYIAARARKNA